MALFGILNIDKPPGCTSRDAVDRVERLARPAKVGHAGTLDPLASGVLVICVGKATRLIQYVQRMRKRYRATFLLGSQSETDDVEGNVTVAQGAHVPHREQLDKVIPRFIGEIQQRPPAYSAIKTQGRRAYQLARQGTPPELPARAVTIYLLRVERYDYPEFELSIECGSGTYVRALGRDIAAALDTTAVMSALRRTAIGGFRVDDSLALDEVSADAVRQRLQPSLSAVSDMPRVVVSEAEVIEIRHGRPIKLRRRENPPAEASSPSEFESIDEWAAVEASGQIVAILRQKKSGELWPEINLESDADVGNS
ncbi:MAG TPA: tRNA pseudouridine(55) synthase TruB [Lacipirellulaceae bacterium]